MPDLSPWYMDYPLAELKGDPEVMRRSERRLQRFQLERKARRQKVSDSLKEGLEKFDIDLPEAWMDQEGFDEITSKVDKSRQAFIELHKRGVDLERPRSREESMLAKKMDVSFRQIQKDIDLYNESKVLWSGIKEKIRIERGKEPHEQIWDIEATEKNLEAALDAPTIREKYELLNKGIIVSKAKPIDLQKSYSTMLDQVMIGQESWKGKVIDPVTGKVDVKTVAGTSEKSLRAANKKLIETMPERELKQYKAAYDAEIYKEGKSFEEWMMKFSPISLKKITEEEEKEKVTGTGPTKDEAGNIFWAEPIKNYKSIIYGKDIAYQSEGSIGLGNVFTKPILLPVLPSTINIESGEPEITTKEYHPTTPIVVNLFPVAGEDISLPAFLDVELKGIIPKGEKIPAKIMKYIDTLSGAAVKPKYKIEIKAFLDQRIDFTKLPIAVGEKLKEKLEYIKTFGRSSFVPYEEIRSYLMTKEGFLEYDNAIRKKLDELNQNRFSVLSGKPEKLDF